jgi:glycosyltransferase involved in cell wall biosynthesis
MKTIVIFTTYAFSLTQFRENLIKELISKSHRVYTIAPDMTPEIEKKLIKLGVICHSTNFERTGTNIIKDFKESIHIYSLIKSLKPDCLLTYNIKPIIYGTVCGFFAGVDHRVAMVEGLGSVFADHDNNFSLKKWLKSLLVSKMYKVSLLTAHKVIFLNQDDLEYFNEKSILSSSKAKLLGGIGVNLNEWVAKPPSQNPITFIMTARLLREKGVEDYINAARIVKAQYPKTRFILLGGLDLNPTSLKAEEVNKWVDEDVIEWPGHVPVLNWLNLASVFVLPSYYREGVPRSSQEALAVGLPIITTDSVGCKETVIDGVNGYLVPIKSAETLAKKMMHFINNPNLITEMGKKSRELAESNFSEEKKIATQLEILKC